MGNKNYDHCKRLKFEGKREWSKCKQAVKTI